VAYADFDQADAGIIKAFKTGMAICLPCFYDRQGNFWESLFDDVPLLVPLLVPNF